MISSRATKLSFAVLLILTLVLKVLAAPNQLGPEERANMVRNQIAGFLARHGLQPGLDDSLGVSGRSGECRLLVVEAAYQGWHRDTLRRLAAQKDQLRFYFRGRMYADQPIWLTRLSGHWATFLQSFGLNTPVEPVLGIVASPICNLNAMPWQELADKLAAVR